MAPAVKKERSESPSRIFSLREKLGKQLQFFSVDRNNRWPLQGWSSGASSSSDEAFHDLQEQFVAEECARPFTLDKETRWPLQGWCRAHKPYNASDSSDDSSQPLVPSRWPQGW